MPWFSQVSLFNVIHNYYICHYSQKFYCVQISQGFVDRNGVTSLNIVAAKGQALDLFIENQGRINYGSGINDNRKVSF